MHDAPGIMRCHIAYDTNAPALHIHLDFGEMRGKGIDEMRRTAGRDLGCADDIARETGHSRGEIQASPWLCSADQLARFYAYGGCLKQGRSPLQQMPFGILSGEFDRRTTGDCCA
jgi:hypothetical protein